MGYPLQYSWASFVAQLVKNLPARQETWVWSPEKGIVQYSGLENSMDCIAHGVAKSQTWLSNLHFHFSSPSLLALLPFLASCALHLLNDFLSPTSSCSPTLSHCSLQLCSRMPPLFFTCMLMRSHFSHVWLCYPMDCSLPVSSLHGIFQTRILEWVAMPYSRGSSQPRDWTGVSCVSCTVSGYSLPLSHQGSPYSTSMCPNTMHSFRFSVYVTSPQSSPAPQPSPAPSYLFLFWTLFFSHDKSLIPFEKTFTFMSHFSC